VALGPQLALPPRRSRPDLRLFESGFELVETHHVELVRLRLDGPGDGRLELAPRARRGGPRVDAGAGRLIRARPFTGTGLAVPASYPELMEDFNGRADSHLDALADADGHVPRP
jgi:hypothetical protein